MFVSFQNIYFYTSTINNWQNLLETDYYKKIIIDALEFNVNSKRIKLFGFVIMPNHLHLIFELLVEDPIYFQRNFNKYTSQQIIGYMIAKGKEKTCLITLPHRQIESTKFGKDDPNG
jgi:REP element-mobilizing transposase RayT